MSNPLSFIAIELFGQGLRISNGKQLLASSPSFALIEADNIQVGAVAEQQAHLRPREICTQFWQNLSGQSSTKHVVSHAHIAFKHLESIWNKVGQQQSRAVFICPANLDKNQLGLLLGICKKIGIEISAIVCNATLALQQCTNASTAVFLDMLQKNIVLTELIQNDSNIRLKQTSKVLDYGSEEFTHNCAKIIAEKFIAETRFDPLHSAKYEQQFYDKLTSWLNNLNTQNSTECKLIADNKEYTVIANTDELKLANQHLFLELSSYLNVLFHQHQTLAIVCSSNTDDAYGLRDYLSDLPGCATIVLTDQSIMDKALSSPSIIETSDEIHFITSLTWENNSCTNLSFNNGKLSNLVSIPTHLLISGHAYPLNNNLYLSETENGTDFIVSYEQSSETLGKLFASNNDIRIQTFDGCSILLNNQLVDNISSVKINDVLTINTRNAIGRLIKVVQNET